MTRRPKPELLALALVLVALLGTGCGADDEALIPGSDADALVDDLDALEDQFDDGDCDELPGSIAGVQAQVDDLPAAVNPELRDALSTGVDELTELRADCEEPEIETETVPTTPTAPPTTTEETVPTEPETETDETETDETETEETEPEPEEDNLENNFPGGAPIPDDSSGPGSGGQGGDG